MMHEISHVTETEYKFNSAAQKSVKSWCESAKFKLTYVWSVSWNKTHTLNCVNLLTEAESHMHKFNKSVVSTMAVHVNSSCV